MLGEWLQVSIPFRGCLDGQCFHPGPAPSYVCADEVGDGVLSDPMVSGASGVGVPLDPTTN